MLRLTSFLLLCSSAIAFTSISMIPGGVAWQHSALRMSSTSTTDLPIILNGQNIELTPALVDHVNKRIGTTLGKLASHGAVRECDVVLSVNKNPAVRVEVCDSSYYAIERSLTFGFVSPEVIYRSALLLYRSRTVIAWKL